MTPAGELLADEIRRGGPISFHRFMETALYHPEYGYYRKRGRGGSDPFGKHGDFFTAEQVQPVFGLLMASRIRQLAAEMGLPGRFTIVELGAGRGEMAEAFADWDYVPVEAGSGAMPERFTGVVFSNEFFDALPVEAAIFVAGEFRERQVGFRDGRFRRETGERCRPDVEEYLRSYFPPPEEGREYEVNLEALGWMERIGQALETGFVLTVDYGYTRNEAARFPAGTLMSYFRHTAREDVLEAPGERDITAHVNFTALEAAGSRYGLRAARLETLAQVLLSAGGPDQFAAVLAGGGAGEELRRRMQLKTLLFGMGETFRVLVQGKDAGKVGRK